VIAKAIKQRFGLHARKVRVQTVWDVYLRWTGIAFVGVALGLFGWLAYTKVEAWDVSIGSKSVLARVEQGKAALEKENADLRSELAVLGRQLQIERASQAELARQVKAMADENARLKEDVALVQAVSASDAKVDGVKISSARVQAGSVAGEYSYRIVLLQTGTRRKPFQGRYQLIVNLGGDKGRSGLALPGPAEQDAQSYRLSFRVSERVEGTFRVDPSAVVRSVQIRVFEGGQTQPRIMQTVTLS
jgi:hypothetical protein